MGSEHTVACLKNKLNFALFLRYSLSLNKTNMRYSLSRDSINRKFTCWRKSRFAFITIHKRKIKNSSFANTWVQSKNEIPFSMTYNIYKSLSHSSSVVAIVNIFWKLQGKYRTCFLSYEIFINCGSFILLEIFKHVFPLGKKQ